MEMLRNTQEYVLFRVTMLLFVSIVVAVATTVVAVHAAREFPDEPSAPSPRLACVPPLWDLFPTHIALTDGLCTSTLGITKPVIRASSH